MCSICGIISIKNQTIPFLNEKINLMNTSLKHRGPDNSASYVDNISGFGHNRLSIIDINKRSNQPFHDKEHNYIIVFNGEIYNYKEIQKKLINKYKFKTNSDTETLLKGFIEYGEKILDLIEGFYSFCIYNLNDKSFFLARDDSGIKPLFYCIENNQLFFASEIKALLKVINQKNLSQESLGTYFMLGYIPSPFTPFREIFQLPPASILYVKNNNYYLKKRNLFKTKHLDKYDLYKTINKAVKNSTVSDVEVGLLLSSGLDSNIILHHLLKNNFKFNTISVGFKNNKSYDETENIKNIIKKHKINGKMIYLEDYNIENLFKHTVYHLDNLNANPANMALNLLFKESSKLGKVFLTGSGMDEFHGGYMTYKASIINDLINKIPGSILLNKLANILNQLNFSSMSKYDYNYLIIKFFSECGSDNLIDHLFWRSIWGPKEIKNLVYNFKPDKIKKFLTDNSNEFLSADKNNNRMMIDYRFFLIDNQMLMIDNLSMAHSIEVRPTFLQKELINLSYSIPSAEKFNLFSNKKLLRDNYKEKLELNLSNSKKTGLVMPLTEILTKKLKKNVFGILDNKKIFDYINYKETEKVINKFYETKNYTNIYKIYNLLTFDEWYKKFI